MRDFMVTQNFEIKSLVSFEQESETVVASIKEYDTLKAIKEAATQDVDAIFVSCTNLRSFSILEEAEAITGKPVLSSNQALAWGMLRDAKVFMSDKDLEKCPGKIFSREFF